MDVLFENDRLRSDLSVQRALQKKWGPEGAKKIAVRLQQLAASPTLEAMRAMPGKCHELVGDRAGQLAVALHQGFRLIFRPTLQPPPSKPDGGLDWAGVLSVTVVEITDYH